MTPKLNDVPNSVRSYMFIDTMGPESLSGRICEAVFPGAFDQLGRDGAALSLRLRGDGYDGLLVYRL